MSHQTLPCAPIHSRIAVQSVDAGDGLIIVVLTAAGSWDLPMHHQGATVLRECLAARPARLIIDLTTLHDPHAQSLPLWAGARLIGADIRPQVPVALCVDPQADLADLLQRRTTHDVLPVYATVRQAQVAMNNQISPHDNPPRC